MKTAIVTWIFYNNYGTQLQAYALQSQLKEFGIDNEIIFDEAIVRPKKATPKVIKESVPKRMCAFILNAIKHPLFFYEPTIEFFKRIHERKIEKSYILSNKYMEKFKSKKLGIYNLKDKNALNSLNDRYDAFICGSDQIWSVLDHNFNGYYYLDFANKKKISYAASIGTNEIPDEKADKIKNWLSDFSAISVREKDTANLLTELLQKNVDFVCDPTLLHDEVFWKKFCLKREKRKTKYLLCYFLENKDWYFDYAEKISSHLGLKLIMIPNKAEYCKNKSTCHGGVSPQRFVSLFANADFVLTDSYHGSIFSVIFSKQFIHFKRFEDSDFNNQNIRVSSLFNRLGIDNVIGKKQFEASDIKYLEYKCIQPRLSEFRISSKQFLKRSLFSCDEY